MSFSPEDVLAMTKVSDLAVLSPGSFGDRRLTQTEFEHIAALCGSAWKYSTDPKRAHAILTSGKHSEGFLDTLAMLTYPNICSIFACEQVKCLIDAGVINLANRD